MYSRLNHRHETPDHVPVSSITKFKMVPTVQMAISPHPIRLLMIQLFDGTTMRSTMSVSNTVAAETINVPPTWMWYGS